MNQLAGYQAQCHGHFRRSFNSPGLKNRRFDLSPHTGELLRKARHCRQFQNGNPYTDKRSSGPPRTTLKDSLELEGLNSLSKRHPTDTELDSEITLGRELHTRDILSRRNTGLKYFFDPMRG